MSTISWPQFRPEPREPDSGLCKCYRCNSCPARPEAGFRICNFCLEEEGKRDLPPTFVIRVEPPDGALPYDDEQCPKRGPALTHMLDGHGHCGDCGVAVAHRVAPAPPPPVRYDGQGFTADQQNKLNFMRWEYENGNRRK